MTDDYWIFETDTTFIIKLVMVEWNGEYPDYVYETVLPYSFDGWKDYYISPSGNTIYFVYDPELQALVPTESDGYGWVFHRVE